MQRRDESTKSQSSARRRCVLALGVVALAVPLLAGGADAAKPRLLVQKRFFQGAPAMDASATFKRATTAHNLIVAYVVWDNADPVTVTDGDGNTYASAIGPTQAPGTNDSAQVFYAANIAGGVDTVTATFATPAMTRGAIYIHEYTGLALANPLGGAVEATGTSLTMDSGPLVTSAANELLFAAGESDGRSIGHPNGDFRFRARRYGNMTADQVALLPGSYTATATQRGTSWVMQLVAFKRTGTTPPDTTLLLGVSPNGRYLVDENGTPFLITGDSPQALMVNLSESEAESFFANRQAAGFNLVWINLLCATYTGGRPDGSTFDGILPFIPTDDLSSPNEAYFARVDRILDMAAAHGIVVLLDPAETGSYLSVLHTNGTTKARNYGRYLGARYRDFDNVIWMSGNDFQSWPDASDDAIVQEVARGIQDTDDRHIHTVELDYLVSGSLDDPDWAPLIQLNASYTYYPTYAQVLTDYNRPGPVPTFMVEANYEYEHNAADEGTPEILRRQEYWSLLSGAAGQLYGNRWTWPFIDGWQDNLDTPASGQIAHVNALFRPRRWYDLVPDQSHTVVTGGYGTYDDMGALGDSDYLTAARTGDGALVIAYMPTTRTITVDMSELGAATDAAWYDPSDGTYTTIAGSPFANSGTRNFTPPGMNADGDGDWVLLLEAGLPPDLDPPSVPSGLAASNVTSSQITLSWSPSTDNVAVEGYRLYRDGGLIKTTAATSYTDTALAASTTYSYRVSAYDYSNNESAQSSPPLVISTSAPAPAFVQASYAVPQTPQSSVSATYAAAPTAGNTNILAIGWNDVTSSITAVSDSSGNVYHQAVATFRGNGLSQAIYYASNIAAAAGGANQVTVTFDQAAAFVDLRVTEYANVRQTSPLDDSASSSGNGTTASSGAVTTTVASDLLFAAGMTATTFSDAGPGFASRVITSPDGDIVEDALAASAGNYTATAPLSAGTWLLQLVAFKAAP